MADTRTSDEEETLSTLNNGSWNKIW